MYIWESPTFYGPRSRFDFLMIFLEFIGHVVERLLLKLVCDLCLDFMLFYCCYATPIIYLFYMNDFTCFVEFKKLLSRGASEAWPFTLGFLV